MSIPADLKYTESHEWVRTEADGTLTVGITDHAQEALGDIVFFEVQELGNAVTAGDTVAVIESVKAASSTRPTRSTARHMRTGSSRSSRQPAPPPTG